MLEISLHERFFLDLGFDEFHEINDLPDTTLKDKVLFKNITKPLISKYNLINKLIIVLGLYNSKEESCDLEYYTIDINDYIANLNNEFMNNESLNKLVVKVFGDNGFNGVFVTHNHNINVDPLWNYIKSNLTPINLIEKSLVIPGLYIFDEVEFDFFRVHQLKLNPNLSENYKIINKNISVEL